VHSADTKVLGFASERASIFGKWMCKNLLSEQLLQAVRANMRANGKKDKNEHDTGKSGVRYRYLARFRTGFFWVICTKKACGL
jgi:hypothetical protein